MKTNHTSALNQNHLNKAKDPLKLFSEEIKGLFEAMTILHDEVHAHKEI